MPPCHPSHASCSWHLFGQRLPTRGLSGMVPWVVLGRTAMLGRTKVITTLLRCAAVWQAPAPSCRTALLTWRGTLKQAEDCPIQQQMPTNNCISNYALQMHASNCLQGPMRCLNANVTGTSAIHQQPIGPWPSDACALPTGCLSPCALSTTAHPLFACPPCAALAQAPRCH